MSNPKTILLTILMVGLISSFVLGQSPIPADQPVSSPSVEPPGQAKPENIKELVPNSVREEVESFITSGGKKVGRSTTIIEKVTYQNTPAYKITTETQFIRDIEALATQRFTEESYLKENDLTIIESNITIINRDEAKTIYKITRSEGKLILVTNPENQKEKREEEMSGEFYLPSALGQILLRKELIPGKIYTIPFFQFSPILHDPEPVKMEVGILKKVVEKIMKKDTEGYYCELANPDPIAGVRKITFFIDTRGLVLKQTCDELDLTIQMASPDQIDIPRHKMAFEKKDRRDLFQPTKATPRDDKILIKPPEDKEKYRKMVKTAEDYVRRMNEIDKTYPEADKEKALVKEYTKFIDIHENINRTNFDDLKARMVEIKTEADRFMKDRQAQALVEAKRLHHLCSLAFDRRNWNELTKNAETLVPLLERPGIRGSNYEDKINESIQEVKILQKRAANIMELLGAPPRVSGLVYYTEDKDIKASPLKMQFFGSEISVPVIYRTYLSKPAVLISGKFYQEKSNINDNLQIKMISSDSVTYIYKEEEIKIPFAK
ncbi:MAG: hypothetical protein AAB019_06045 [Planctomycetota bacterium]